MDLFCRGRVVLSPQGMKQVRVSELPQYWVMMADGIEDMAYPQASNLVFHDTIVKLIQSAHATAG